MLTSYYVICTWYSICVWILW